MTDTQFTIERRSTTTFRVDGINPDQRESDSVHDGWVQAFDELDDALTKAS